MNNKLYNASMKFHLACVVKLKKKEKEGWVGWDNPIKKKLLEAKLMEHTLKSLSNQENLVDIANFCNFLWNLIEDEKEVNNK